MRDLIEEPLWQAGDLGHPIPDSDHAVSVALPLWQHVVGYEEHDPVIRNALRSGYPRFVLNLYVSRLFEEGERRFAQAEESTAVFPSFSAARRCVDYIFRLKKISCRIDSLGANGLFAVTLRSDALDVAMDYWRYSGDIVSSRLAQATLEGRVAEGSPNPAKAILRQRIASLSGQCAEDVFLYPSGMAAVYAAWRMVQHVVRPARTVQLQVPYVDVLRVQQVFGLGVECFPEVGSQVYGQLEDLLAGERIAGVFCEIPSNPLLGSIDMPRLSGMLRRHQVPLVLDDTVGTVVNMDSCMFGDVIVTSLTKFFAGQGDVIAGSLVLNRQSPFYGLFAAYLAKEYEDLLWNEDAVVLERESRDFPQRVRRINQNAEAIYEYLRSHRLVDKVWYPKNSSTQFYDCLKRSEGGYGGLMSILLKDANQAAPRFYDSLKVSKGPSLGMNYTLACPYTLLAHYDELERVEQCGIDRHLVRISVGLEETDDLILRLEAALAKT